LIHFYKRHHIMSTSVLLLTLLVSASSGWTVEEEMKIEQHMNAWNSDVQCWGKDNVAKCRMKEHEACELCAQQPMMDITSLKAAALQTRMYNPMQVQPSKYQPMLIPQYTIPSPYTWTNLGGPLHHIGKRSFDNAEILNEFEDFKEEVHSKISNLTCVLTNLGMLDKNTLQVNMKMYQEDLWNQIDVSQSMAADPVWKDKLTNCWNKCHSIAQAWPEEALESNPLHKVLGRQMIFFKCAMKAKKKLCCAGQACRMLETYHPEVQLSMPGKDKYDVAALTAHVMMNSKTEEMEFIDNFFHGAHNHRLL